MLLQRSVSVRALLTPKGGISSRLQSTLNVNTPPTHLLTIPLYQNSEVRSRLEEFRNRLSYDAEVLGLEPSMIIPSINETLVFKLGYVRIKESEIPEGPDAAFEREHVMKVLHRLKTPIRQLLRANGGDGFLRVPLGQIRPLLFRNATFNPRSVKTLVLEPAESRGAESLKAVNQLVFETFKGTGILLRPSVEKWRRSWTPAREPPVLTTQFIKSAGLASRPSVTFDLETLYASKEFRAFVSAGSAPNSSNLEQPVKIDLGTAVASGLYLRRFGKTPETKELIHDGGLEFAD